MMTTIETYVRNRQMQMKKWALRPEIRWGMGVAGFGLGGLMLSGVGFAHGAMPLTMSLLCTLSGWQAVAWALGGAVGYLAFWGEAGLQGILWLGLALPVALWLGKTRVFQESPLMMPAVASLILAASGLGFQIFMGDTTSVGVYLLRVAVGAGGVKFFGRTHQRGETGMIQVQLELMSLCLGEMQQILLESPEVPIDETSLLTRIRERACGGCPNRRGCQTCLSQLPENLLHRPLLDTSSLPFSCKKPGRMIQELRRGQEQLRSIKADRERQGEYRRATIQQYQFLSHFLQHLSDQLPQSRQQRQKYHPEVSVCTAGRDGTNGDRVLWFAGAGCKYYILLCDGMGTGIGAAEAGERAANLLQRMLRAGLPGHYALRSVNSLLTLRGQAGAVTMDLAEVSLDTGRVQLYKWGAAPSYVLRAEFAEKIGTAGPPPGLSVGDNRETTDRLSLRRGEVLILLSDGVDGEAALRRMGGISAQPPGELAAKILEYGAREKEDDATVAAICLSPGALST